jgi:hypothetical protein
MRKINDLVSGKPSNRAGLWAMTNKQASGIGHTLSASACFRIQAHQNIQSLLGFDSNKQASGVGHSLSASACQQICARCRCMYCCDCEDGVRLLFHGNLGSLANNRGNAFHFPRDCMAMFKKASRTFIYFRMNLAGMVSGHVGGAVVNCIVCTFVCVFPSCHRFLPGVVWALQFPGRLGACPPSGREASAVCTFWLVQ